MAEVKKEACEISQAMKSKGWIKNILVACILIVIIAIIVSAFGGSSLLSGSYSKTFDVEVHDLQDTKLCGVQPGERIFKVPSDVIVFVGGEKTVITSAVRVNGTFPKEQFSVDSSGCVTVSFGVNKGFKANSFPSQIIALTFE